MICDDKGHWFGHPMETKAPFFSWDRFFHRMRLFMICKRCGMAKRINMKEAEKNV